MNIHIDLGNYGWGLQANIFDNVQAGVKTAENRKVNQKKGG
jgi:hypothetical protein